jgi:dihydrofolate reductase
MSIVIAGMTISLDGFVQDQHGAQTIQQDIQQGLFDELHIGIAPVLLGAGLRLFEHLGTEPLDLEQTQTTEAAGVTYLRYRIHKPA